MVNKDLYILCEVSVSSTAPYAPGITVQKPVLLSLGNMRSNECLSSLVVNISLKRNTNRHKNLDLDKVFFSFIASCFI